MIEIPLEYVPHVFHADIVSYIRQQYPKIIDWEINQDSLVIHSPETDIKTKEDQIFDLEYKLTLCGFKIRRE